MIMFKVRANAAQSNGLRARLEDSGLQIEYPEEQQDGLLALFLADLSQAHILCKILTSEGVHIVDLGDLKKSEEVRPHHAAILESPDAGYSGSGTDITGRKLAENELKLAQERLHEYERAVEGLEEMIAVVDREYRYRIANNKFLKMRKMTKEHVVGRFARDVLNKGVFDTVIKHKLDECFKGKVVRYEMKYAYPGLGERDILVSYFPVEGVDGVDRVVSIMQDITERKRVEEALRGMHRKLIEAHEEERARIARELHDDISQRLASLSIALSPLKQRLPTSRELVREMEKARKEVINLGSDIQALSHRLHSPKLELLGLTRAITALCAELSERQGVTIDFKASKVPRKLPDEVALCLFRVLQEALQNAIKHSGSRHFQVWLRGRQDEIELNVHDSGRGFEPEEASNGPGLGLTSMRERMALVNGQLSIDSKPNRGTTIQALVPINSKKKSAAANK